MREGLAAVEDISAGIKKVIGSRDSLIAKRGIEVPRLDIETITDGYVSLKIGLWKCDTVSAGRFTAQIEIPFAPVCRCTGILIERGDAESLSIDGVRAEHKIEAAADVP